MNEQSKQLYKDSKEFFTKRTIEMKELEESAKTLDDCIDMIYAIRESVEYIESIRKELESLSKDLQTTTAFILMSRHKKSYSTENCTGTRRSSIVNGLPTKKKEPENYATLMTHLGIPADVIRKELVRVHWPAFKEYCTELASKGLPSPPGVKEPTSFFGITIRKKKDILSTNDNQLELFTKEENDDTPF